MRSILTLLFVPALLLTVGCSSVGPEAGNTYRYSAFDGAGDALVTGTLRLDYGETGEEEYPIRITGSWRLTQVKAADQVGPQVGTGRLQGSVSADGQVWINLNPDWNDNNVTLIGRFADGHFSDIAGTWTYSMFVGSVNGGRFEVGRRWGHTTRR